MRSPFLDKSRVDILLGDYCTAPASVLTDTSLLPKAQEYRRLARSRMQPLDREGIAHKIPAADFHVSRKVDGEFTVLAFQDGVALTINPGGTVRVGLPVLDEAARLLEKAGVRQALVAAEFYVQRSDNSRSRVHDVATVARKPQSASDLQSLRLAVFDIISKDGDTLSQSFSETWKLIQQWFSKGSLIHPVEAKMAKSTSEIQKLFHDWVEEEGSEGLVVRSDDAGTFKIKPRYSLDLAVLGFTESVADRQGMLHDMLLGVKRPDNTLQVLGRVGGGFSDDQRRDYLSDLKDMAVDSEYAEVNGDNVAYQMVKPEWVVEVNCLDLLSETTRGGAINRMVLDYRNNGSRAYHVVTKLPLATIISPQFLRRREDKQVRPDDCGIPQVANIVEVQYTDRDARQLTLPLSHLVRREVYTKDLKGQTMVRKFVMWTTNKEKHSDEFPAYVLHYTDFSPNRKDPLARELRVSNSQSQIEQLWEGFKAENIKGGWNLQNTAVPAIESPKSQATEPAEPDAKSRATLDAAPLGAEPPDAAPEKKRRKKALPSPIVAETTVEPPTQDQQPPAAELKAVTPQEAVQESAPAKKPRKKAVADPAAPVTTDAADSAPKKAPLKSAKKTAAPKPAARKKSSNT